MKFWSSSCVNCIQSHAGTNKLYQDFKKDGFEILGFHTPEFSYEREIKEVKQAVRKQ